MTFAYVTVLFLAWGFVTSIIDGLAPTARAVFSLSYTEQMLTQFAFFLAYGLVSLPAAALLARFAAPRTILIALSVMVVGCLIVLLGARGGSYPVILLALFVLASGVTVLQVAANPLSAALGTPERSHFRLTLSQAFNSFGTVLGPLVASHILLSGGVFDADASHRGVSAQLASLHKIETQFLIIAALLVLLGVFIWSVRRTLHAPQPQSEVVGGSLRDAFRSPWALFGALAIFLYVGSEVSEGTIMINFLSQKEILGISPADAAHRLGLYFWGGAMVGRLLGSQLLRVLRASTVLATFAIVNILLCLSVTFTSGEVGAVSALALGFFNSVMFPTIFTLTLDRSDAPVASVSGLLCTAIVGGAFVPPLVGFVSDHASISAAFAVPLVGYVGIAVFALARSVGKGKGAVLS